MRRNTHRKLKDKVYKRDNWTCQLKLSPKCKGYMLPDYEKWKNGKMTRRRVGISVDHKRPISKGGKWSLDNLVCACTPCNQLKGNHYDDDG